MKLRNSRNCYREIFESPEKWHLSFSLSGVAGPFLSFQSDTFFVSIRPNESAESGHWDQKTNRANDLRESQKKVSPIEMFAFWPEAKVHPS